ncbi:hypothetical protein KKF81_02680 [Candidatus Micrarchaeota archaeon]|nr:hypothetical protein [Candidatus Micrarchaeota archaeon]MBU1165827.1 hypothetical protein [Candidatus Micrarchaeota archaeon]MBU1886831.1 hypothetical protein [Candidatus Micrarchaeota archaeon]
MKADKSLILKIAVVVIAVLFMTELFFFGGTNFSVFFSSTPKSANITGITTFNGTIRTYDPVLALDSGVDNAMLTEIRNLNGVKDVRMDPNGILIETETRDDVYPVASYLRDKNLSSVSIANIALPAVLELETTTETINITSGYGAIRIMTEPLLDVDSIVTISMIGVASNGKLIDYGSPQLMLDQVELPVSARILALQYKKYTYVVPWESRNSLGNLSEYGNSTYTKLDSIIFLEQLTIDQVMAKKVFPYIYYIDTKSAQVAPDFDNLSKVELNFQDVSIVLPDSSLTLFTDQTPDTSFEYSVEYVYEIILMPDSTDYTLHKFDYSLTTNRSYEVNGTLNVTVSGVASGKELISMRKISLPS